MITSIESILFSFAKKTDIKYYVVKYTSESPTYELMLKLSALGTHVFFFVFVA